MTPPGDDPYTTREIKEKFDSFGRDLAEIKLLLTGDTFVRADLHNLQIAGLVKDNVDQRSRMDSMQSTIRQLAIAFVAALATGLVTAIITVHP